MAGAWEVREVQCCIHFHGPYGNSVVCAAAALDSSDPSGHVCVCWMVSSVERGVTLTPAYGYPFWRRVFTNTAMLPGRPWGLWFVNELLYWLAFAFASLQCFIFPSTFYSWFYAEGRMVWGSEVITECYCMFLLNLQACHLFFPLFCAFHS